MIPSPRMNRAARLVKAHEYRRVYKKGRFIRGGGVRLYIHPTDNKVVRVGVSISRAIVNKAKNRNRIKRIIKEWFRKNKNSIKRGVDIVVVVRQDLPITRTGSRAIRNELVRLLGDEIYSSVID